MGFFVIVTFSAKEFSRRTYQELAASVFIQQTVNAWKLMGVGDMLAIQRRILSRQTPRWSERRCASASPRRAFGLGCDVQPLRGWLTKVRRFLPLNRSDLSRGGRSVRRGVGF